MLSALILQTSKLQLLLVERVLFKETEKSFEDLPVLSLIL